MVHPVASLAAVAGKRRANNPPACRDGVEPLARRQRADILTQYRKTENDVVHEMLTVKTETPFSHNGDDFLTVDTEFGLINIRWSAVVGYVGPLPK